MIPRGGIEEVEQIIAENLAHDPHFYDDPNTMHPVEVHLLMNAYDAASHVGFRREMPAARTPSGGNSTRFYSAGNSVRW